MVEVDESGQALLKQFGYGHCGESRVKKARWCPLVELHISGENANDHHGGKHTGGYGSYALRYVSCTDTTIAVGRRVSILLSDGRMNVTANYDIFACGSVVRAWTTVKSIGNVPVGLEYVSSFAYTGLDDAMTPGAEQRIHLSGKITELSGEAFAQMKEGVDVYKTYRDLIPTALPVWPLGVPDQQAPWISMGLRCADRMLLAVWRLNSDEDRVYVPVADKARVLYPAVSDAAVTCFENGLAMTLPRQYTAVLLLIC